MRGASSTILKAQARRLFDQNLNWDDHIQMISKEIATGISAIFLIYRALVQSQLHIFYSLSDIPCIFLKNGLDKFVVDFKHFFPSVFLCNCMRDFAVSK